MGKLADLLNLAQMRARELGVPILDEAQFVKLLAGGPEALQ